MKSLISYKEVFVGSYLKINFNFEHICSFTILMKKWTTT
jgi:hypothetical protein